MKSIPGFMARFLTNIGFVFALATIAATPHASFGQTTAFTYQGRLVDNGVAAAGIYDLRFTIFDAATNGAAVSDVITSNSFSITNGLFTVSLDFGAGIFDGNPRWLDIAVRTNGFASFTSLNPREPVTPVPTALFAGAAATATTLSGVVPAASLNGTYGGAVNFVNSSNSFSGDGAGLFHVPGTLNSQLQSSTMIQAVPNTSYILTNSQPVTVTLPANPQIGDVIRIAGTGAGGWALAQNPGQTILGYNLINPLTPWAPLTNSFHAQGLGLASSADGTHLLSDNVGYWDASSDSGATWFILTNAPPAVLSYFALSADGQHAIAAAPNTRIYTCSTFADNWIAQSNSVVTNYSGAALSADGSRMVAIVNGGGIYVSSDFGTNWLLSAAPSNAWVAVTASADGSRMAAAASHGGIYLSTDYGVNWHLSPAPATNQWQVMTSSANGSRIFAIENTNVWISADFGQSWSSSILPGSSWYAVSCSADGSRVAGTSGTVIEISTDGGATWSTSHAPAMSWRGIACTTTGNFFANTFLAGVFAFQTSTSVGQTGFLAGNPYSAVELQFVGNGKFLPLSHEGTLVAH